MRAWMTMLGGLLLWAAHFFALYLIGEFGGSGRAARVAVVAVTIVVIIVAALIGRRLRKSDAADHIGTWGVGLGQGALLLSATAIIWQSFPVFLT